MVLILEKKKQDKRNKCRLSLAISSFGPPPCPVQLNSAHCSNGRISSSYIVFLDEINLTSFKFQPSKQYDALHNHIECVIQM